MLECATHLLTGNIYMAWSHCRCIALDTLLSISNQVYAGKEHVFIFNHTLEKVNVTPLHSAFVIHYWHCNSDFLNYHC